jgi:hypothetical protein
MAKGKWQTAKVKTKFENQDWKLEIEDANPQGAVSARFIGARFAIYHLSVAFCLAH